MPEPVDFLSHTPRLALPLLFAGQAQKEFFVNQSLSLVDMLLQAAVEGEASVPPVSPADGESWLVGSAAEGGWSGYEGHLASWQSGVWLFAYPSEGWQVFDRDTRQAIRYSLGEWQRVQPPAAPVGGSVEDTEARQAIADLVAALRANGIFAG
ncbi:MAG: DUF2793 domain-containing protein [Sphingomonadales bacterium]|nr:DUF2793 domain-containing protein [Sphingomonadales bacterium]MBD3773786.1 DUF2793 domain-containing protein [Paracoccaceae bacterium]